MKKFIAFIFVVLFSATLFGETECLIETVDGVEYTYSVSNGEATIGNGILAAVSTETAGRLEMPYLLGGFPVSKIGKCAFKGCDSITSIFIHGGITEIAENAFDGCRNLEAVDFQYSTSGSTISSGNVVNIQGALVTSPTTAVKGSLKIGDYAFASCDKITRVAFPERLDEIGEGVFYKCISLKEVRFYGDKPLACMNFYEGIPSDTTPTTYIGVPPSMVITDMTSFVPPNSQSWENDIEKGDFLGYPIKRLICVFFDFSRGRSASTQGGSVINNQGSVVTSPTTAITATIGDESLRNNIVPGSAIGRFPRVTKDNFSLTGWRVDDEYIDENYVVESNIVIKARWRPIVGDLNPTLKSFMAEVGENNPDSLTILNKKLISGEIVMSSDEASLIIEWLLDEIDEDVRKSNLLEKVLDIMYDKTGIYRCDRAVIGIVLSRKPADEWTEFLNKVEIRQPLSAFEKEILVEELTDVVVSDFNKLPGLVKVYEKYIDHIPHSIKATIAEKLSGTAIEHLQYMKEVARIYELSGDAIPISIREGLSEKIETAVVSQKAIYPGIKEALYALGTDGDDRWNRICATVLEIELGDLLSLTSSEVCEWIAYDLAEQYSSKYNVDKRGYLNLFKAKYGDAYENMLAMQTGKIALDGRMLCVGHDYLAGTDPLDPNDKFAASVTIVDGKPVVSYTPELDDARKALRKYTTYGKVKLTDTDWTVIPEGEEENYNFFKVTVEMK